MGTGIDLARPDAPEHAAAIENMKDQLLIVLVRRLGGRVDIPVTEIDDTGSVVLLMNLDQNPAGKPFFHFEVKDKH